jgi:hypothetical protein
MTRWLAWFLLAPQGFLLCGLLASSGLPLLDCGALLCVFCALFADVRALPGLLLGSAVGRAMVDEASISVQILVLGVPLAVLLPMRPLFYRHHVWWQVVVALACAIAIPKLAGLCGSWFGQPSASSQLSFSTVLWTAVLGPVLLWPLTKLPPLRAFVEKLP